MMENTYGFIGLGAMGYPMAVNLRRKLPSSAKVVIAELNEKVVQRFLEETKDTGAVEVALTPKEVVTKSDVIITMLPAGIHVWKVFTDESTGLLSIDKDSHSRLFLDCSTIDTTTCKKVGEAVKASGLGSFADAPVSGGPEGAAQGTLTFMVGGGEELFGRVKPIVKMMGKEPFFCGPLGAGLATKSINNYLSGICTIGTSEAMNMGIRYGLDPKVLAGVINVSSGQNYNSKLMNPVAGVVPGNIADKGFEGGFSMELCTGVLKLGRQLADDTKANSIFGDAMINAFETASKDPRCKGKDSRSIYLWIADK